MNWLAGRFRRGLSGVALAAGLAACGGSEAPDTSAMAASGGVPQAVNTVSAAPILDCSNGAPLPVTGVCNNADPSLFLAVDPEIESFAANCIWRTEELKLSRDQALVFRAQDCTAEGWVRIVYTHVSGYVKHRMDGTPADQAGFALEIFPLKDGETPEQAAMKTLEKAPEDQRTRCEIRALPGPKVAGRPFALAPNGELQAELEALHPDEPWDACGPNGVTQDGTQFWEARASYALFHLTGQETPAWDPASFTFYRRGSDKTWTKVN